MVSILYAQQTKIAYSRPEIFPDRFDILLQMPMTRDV